jgi:predicted GIY-YIG superfamily endonuclease
MSYYVYGITTTEHDKLIYIGASRDPQKRLYEHIASRGQQDTQLQKRLFENQSNVGVIVLAECENWRNALDKEKELIQEYYSKNHPLLNKVHTPSYIEERLANIRKKTLFHRQPEQVEKRAGMKRVMDIHYKSYIHKISDRKMNKECPFFKEASRLFYISKEQYDTVAMAFPQMDLKL